MTDSVVCTRSALNF